MEQIFFRRKYRRLSDEVLAAADNVETDLNWAIEFN
jgi:hypothetical protein